MRKIREYNIQPSLPERLQGLAGLARNLWWTWNPDAFSLWRRLDAELWESTYHNPVKLLGKISQSRLDQLAEDDGFTTHMDRVMYNLMNYMESKFWFHKNHKKDTGDIRIAYFSAEYGLTESLPIYSGGLGILSGDHLKSASDLGLPLVGVGLLYTQGYFKQYLNPDGWQQEFYPDNDFYNMSIFPERDDEGSEITIKVPYPGRMVTAKVWRTQVGRTPLYLLDSNTNENSPEDREITHQLYGGDIEMRIKQEIMLGIGGVIALTAAGVEPDVFHMNEGHSAFLTLERMRGMIEKEEISFEVAKEKIIASSVFTTHTPVPAGNDIFSPQLMQKYFSEFTKGLKIDFNEFMALGRSNTHDNDAPFSMPELAMRLSAFTNGVSELHSEVSKKLWAHLYKGLDENDVPIRSITNGVHIRSWLSEDMWNLFDRYLGQHWIHEPANDTVWRRINDIPDAELWRAHERRRERFVGFARERLKLALKKRGATAMETRLADEVLSPESLTIGFARRFAAYKRGNLLFMDIDRLKSILCNKERPIQIVLAGKAHPRDQEGKRLIQNIIHWIRDDELKSHIVFIEDYDINVARSMVQGVDVWLNTPRRPMEASGTSGMKASANGALNMSVLDGWWCEGYKVDTGWAIGGGEDYEDHDEQDLIESRMVYDLLEKELAPLFYDRGKDDMPRGWIKMMKSSLSNLNAVFNTNRMVRNYTQFFYIPCAIRSRELSEDGGKRVKALSEWKKMVEDEWSNVSVGEITEAGGEEDHLVGRMLEVSAYVHTGALKPEDLKVEVYYGSLDANSSLVDGKPAPMVFEKMEEGKALFKGSVPLTESGRYGYSIRVLPNHPDLFGRIEPGLVCWNE
ncbi:Glycogen phosphorylase [hydrothermal vent metagenome]|uniref:Glycogen phosphorylase n=1 Tax=hydrothermal vent metagenome TaxID=652676 RepID=A0A3B1D0Z3_9ZZZZ